MNENIRKTANDLDRAASGLRREAVRKLRDEAGLTFEEIGRALGVSRSRAHQLYHDNKAQPVAS